VRNYENMSNLQLSSLLRQLQRSKIEISCELGHPACGCSNVQSMDGNAPCAEQVQKELDRRDATYALICGTCQKEHTDGQCYNHNFVKREAEF
jgi:hypothetical protein